MNLRLGMSFKIKKKFFLRLFANSSVIIVSRLNRDTNLSPKTGFAAFFRSLRNFCVNTK